MTTPLEKTILITGGAGFIGSRIAAKLLEQGYQVSIIDNLATGKKPNVPKGANFYQADITDFETVKRILDKEKPDIVSHHAAQAQVRFSVAHPHLDAEINIRGLLNILEASKERKQTQMIFASSGGAIYDGHHHRPVTEKAVLRPLSPYGVSKLTSEAYLNMYSRVYGLKTTILRYANVYGPFQAPEGEAGIVAMFIHKLNHSESPTIFGDGNHVRDYIYIDDVVAANLEIIKRSLAGTYNIGTGVETTTKQILQKITHKMKNTTPAIFAPPQLGEQEYNCLDCRKASRYFEWTAHVKLSDGIQKTIEWQKTYAF